MPDQKRNWIGLLDESYVFLERATEAAPTKKDRVRLERILETYFILLDNFHNGLDFAKED